MNSLKTRFCDKIYHRTFGLIRGSLNDSELVLMPFGEGVEEAMCASFGII